MNKPISTKIYTSLINYYINCLETEDMFSIIFNIKDKNKIFIVNPLPTESFFHDDDDQLSIPTHLLSNSLTKGTDTGKKEKNFYYGYPLICKTDNTCSPLFFTELSITTQDENMIVFKGTTREFNHTILSTFGFEIEEIQRIRLENQGKKFTEQLTDILSLLHESVDHFTKELDSEHSRSIHSSRIVNKSILYLGTRTGITKNLVQELYRLKKIPSNEIRSTSLGIFLGEKPYKNLKTSSKDIIEVFPLNNSQRHAVNHALSNQLTVITGPPGTGKSQVVLNIVANAVFQDKTILFSSKNNKAVDVVREKLQPILTKPLIVRMGAERYRKESKETLNSLFPYKARTKGNHEIEKQIVQLSQINKKMDSINDSIQELMKLNNTIDIIQDEIITLLQKIPSELYTFFNTTDFHLINLSSLGKQLKKYGNDTRFHHSVTKRVFFGRPWKKIQQTFKKYHDSYTTDIGIYLENSYRLSSNDMYQALHILYLSAQMMASTEHRRYLEEQLLEYEPIALLYKRYEEVRKDRITLSRNILDEYWLNKLDSTSSVDQEAVLGFFEISEQLGGYIETPTLYRSLISRWKNKIQQIFPFLPIWVITTLSARKSIPFKENLFDILIIDEASQCDIASAFPLFYRARHVVVIGDPKQLRHISLLTEKQDREIATKNQIEHLLTVYSYTKNSVYDLADSTSSQNADDPILLDEHYRCSRDIISFSNECFYGKLLHILTDERQLRPVQDIIKHGILWYHVSGTTIRSGSSYNREEADYIIKLLHRLLGLTDDTISFGVVTLFRAQMEIIRQMIRDDEKLRSRDITVGTAHRFQGDEKDIILFSPVVSSGVKEFTVNWVQSTQQLINVAITRAKTAVIIVGDEITCSKSKGILGELVSYAQTPKADTIIEAEYKRLFYELMSKNKIQVIPGYWVRCENNTKYQIDFALFVHTSKYALWIIDDEEDDDGCSFDRYTVLRKEGWKNRRFNKKEILKNPDAVIEHVKRFC